MNLLVNIDVDDLEKATRFYCDGLGLSVGRRFDGGTKGAPQARKTMRGENCWSVTVIAVTIVQSVSAASSTSPSFL